MALSPLPPPRPGQVDEFHIHRKFSVENTLSAPEDFIWSSISQLCSFEYAAEILENAHGIKSRRTQEDVAGNISVYIRQAHQFYLSAKLAQLNTAPLLYYYCFLNLAKARCEMANPNFHQMPESYRHGISWAPNPKYEVYVPTDSVRLTTRGVWHVLWESLRGQSIKATNPSNLKISDLFRLCGQIEVERERTIKRSSNLLILVRPELVRDRPNSAWWFRFCVMKDHLKKKRISRKNFLALPGFGDRSMQQVHCNNSGLWAFEFARPIGYRPGEFKNDSQLFIRKLNLFCEIRYPDLLVYAVADQRALPVQLPQILSYYSILFWLGSLVRYDPHSIEGLQDSRFWILVEGFLGQSLMWLLELFEWELYQSERKLLMTR